MTGTIRAGIGGWNFPPWRGTFYPKGLTQARELSHASSHVTAIEINATFYGRQKPESFARWRDETPDGFVFAVKASRFTTHRRELLPADVDAFVVSGITALGPKLGPILWQFAPTRRFDAGVMGAFVASLPAKQDGLALRHVIETRHESFADPAWPMILREHGVAHAIVESDTHVLLGDLTAPFVYARLEMNDDSAAEGYDGAALDAWAGRAKAWAAGKPAAGLTCIAPAAKPAARDAFVFFISGEKVAAPRAAQAFLHRVSG